MSFAADTPVGTPTGTRLLRDIERNDQVLAGSTGKGSQSVPFWSLANVAFREGAASGASVMIFLGYGQGGTLIVTKDQPFLLASGKLKTASQLVAGEDLLVDPDGKAVALREVRAGQYRGGVGSIAASPMQWHGTVDGHLIETGGVVSGDYLVQVHTGAGTAEASGCT